MGLGKEIGWIRPKNTDGEYDDSLIKSQIKILDEELDKIQDDMILFKDTNLLNVEGSNISTDSSVGYAKDIEILGNTIQDASNLADIRSVGDKVEGQELYKIDVVSCGKNLFSIDMLMDELQKYSTTLKKISEDTFKIEWNGVQNEIFKGLFKENTIYTFSKQSYMNSSDCDQVFFYIVYTDGTSEPFYAGVMSKTSKSQKSISHLSVGKGSGKSETTYTGFMIKEGTQATPYELYQEDKLTILSPVQLEKVGDVADRIICKDGVWGVEKNIGVLEVDKSYNYIDKYNETFVDGARTNAYTYNVNIPYEKYNISRNNVKSIAFISNKFTYKNACWNKAPQFDVVGLASAHEIANNMYFNVPKHIDTIELFKEYIKGVYLVYQLAEPQFIPLPHDQQVKLRTFAGQTNIHFETEIEGTIKAQVPKSIGATVNTHTEQIGNLSKELDRVKKLEESTVSTVTTESGFTTVEETSNGYFEDVKLEGKTLVNLFDKNKEWEGTIYKELHLNNVTNGTFSIIGKIEDKSSNSSDAVVEIKIKNTSTGEKRDVYAFFSNRHSDINKVVMLTQDEYLYFRCFDVVDDKFNKNYPTMMILEGDHTQNPPSYFEGLKSVGQDVEEIVVSSVKGNGNLFDGELEIGNINLEGVNDTTDYTDRKRSKNYIKIKPNHQYRITHNKSDNTVIVVRGYDINKRMIHNFSSITSNTVINTPNGCEYIRFVIANNESNLLVMINEGVEAKPYTPYLSDKKRLLYYNPTTQTWEKPILRQWDSIEKHSDGKYYYHKRSGEVVLNGSENGWIANSNVNGVYRYELKFNPTGLKLGKIISNKFIWKNNGFDENDAWLHGENGALCIRSLIDNIQGFKQWLQANNVTVVYQLAQEEVYECTNIDLITYENETNYVVNCGAIAPLSTLKVMCNINNVVRELQQKASNLENYIQHVMIDALNNALNE